MACLENWKRSNTIFKIGLVLVLVSLPVVIAGFASDYWTDLYAKDVMEVYKGLWKACRRDLDISGPWECYEPSSSGHTFNLSPTWTAARAITSISLALVVTSCVSLVVCTYFRQNKMAAMIASVTMFLASVLGLAGAAAFVEEDIRRSKNVLAPLRITDYTVAVGWGSVLYFIGVLITCVGAVLLALGLRQTEFGQEQNQPLLLEGSRR